MKGPMVTQTLKGIAEQGLMHWRGDQRNMFSFNNTFSSLMGGEQLNDEAINLLAAWSESVVLSPNPNQRLNRALTAEQEEGKEAFTTITLPNGSSCEGCHALPNGSNSRVRNQPVGETQPLEIAPLRQMYRKQGMSVNGPSKMGFGFTHDGTEPSLQAFVSRGLLPEGAAQLGDEVTEFLLALDTGTSPLVGQQVLVSETQNESVLDWMLEAVTLGDIDLIATFYDDADTRQYLYNVASGNWQPDNSTEPVVNMASLLEQSNSGSLVIMAVYPGTGRRLALDFNQDGWMNRTVVNASP
jgi:hypothetical protein